MRIIGILLLFLSYLSYAQPRVSTQSQAADTHFPMVTRSSSAVIYYDAAENPLVKRSADFLSGDLEMITGQKPKVTVHKDELEDYVIVIGTVGNSPLVKQLVDDEKLNVDPIRDQWERFIIQAVEDPLPGVDQALVIVGSDRRGAAYGVFTLSESMGVSPWYWWADVPVKKSKELYLEKGRFVSEGPLVKYRGIFINDEAPALRNWAREKFGGLNHEFYEKVFELLLRNKANYLWPAMWLPTIFNEDDPLNPKVADEYGIVISTSHHEPMMRSHNEWSVYDGGEWNYETNKEKLQEFWKGGIERMENYESVVTVGMRGDGDEGMSEETAVDLLQRIIKDQREILEDVTGKPAEEIPQVWAVYKEVQDYYDQGMRVPDDITILFSDDNWGNLRILPKEQDLDHPGGYGLYYHFDYVGAPVSYKWLNTTQIERVWEQMNMAYQHGVKELWLVNVGDIKPMEFPISFFLDFAWDPEAIEASDLPDYYVSWAKQQFGSEQISEIADLLRLYTKYNARRTPEMLKPDTYSIENYREADRIVEEYNHLLQRSSKVFDQLSTQYKSAYYQLVHSPIALSANLNQMDVAAGKNRYYGVLGTAAANYYAKEVERLFQRDAELTRDYHEMEDGKWNHMMSQTHIGYTYWNHPPLNLMPAVSRVQLAEPAELGYFLEYGDRPRWGWLDVEADWSFSTSLPEFDPVNDQSYYIDVVNRGQEELNYQLSAENDWIQLSKTSGTTQYHEMVYVSIDWEKVPDGTTEGEITISGAGNFYTVIVPLRKEIPAVSGFVENNGVIAFDAAHYTRKVDSKEARWTEVPNLGRTGSAMMLSPVTARIEVPGKNSPQLEYDFSVFDASELLVAAYLSPTQDFKKQGGLRYAIAIDDEEPQIININEGEIKPDWEYAEWWSKSVGDHIKIKQSSHSMVSPGKHTLKVWAIDPGVVFQKVVINAGGEKDSYLGPPESKYVQP